MQVRLHLQTLKEHQKNISTVTTWFRPNKMYGYNKSLKIINKYQSFQPLDFFQALKLSPHPGGSQSTPLFQKEFTSLAQSLSIQQLFYLLVDNQTAKYLDFSPDYVAFYNVATLPVYHLITLLLNVSNLPAFVFNLFI